MLIKNFESFNNDNSKVWIFGIPSGESFQIDRDILQYLFKEKLVFYTTKYVDIGFHAFKDENVEKIKSYVIKDSNIIKPYNNNFSIYDNNFNPTLINNIISIIERFNKNVSNGIDINFYVQEDYIGIDLQDIFIEIQINETKINSKYRLTKTHLGKIIDKYNVISDENLLNRLYHEIYA